jgi:hypothetical protein
MAETTNALVQFLKSSKITLGKDKYCPEKFFVEAFNDHCKEMNSGKPRWTSQYTLGPFSTFDITLKKNLRLRYPDQPGERLH